MDVNEKIIEVRLPGGAISSNILDLIDAAVKGSLDKHAVPVRMAVTGRCEHSLYCEIAMVNGFPESSRAEDLFTFRPRAYEDASQFNTVFLVPTGIGAELGGHSGDAGPAARLLAACCDTLITHPNVGNAADINELPDNTLYVEGSVIADLMMGGVGIAKVRSNRILLLMEQHPDPWFMDATINMASAARAAAGIDVTRVGVLGSNFSMRSDYAASGRAAGVIEGLQNVTFAIDKFAGEFDAVALCSLIKVPAHFHADYFSDSADSMVNPWGGVEAMLTHTLSRLYRVPTAHAPMMTSRDVQTLDFGPVDPRKAAEPVSATYLFSVLKGLHRSPRIVDPLPMRGAPGCLTAENIHCLVIPDGCVGLPTIAALQQGMHVVAVREGNRNRMINRLSDLPFAVGKLHFARNYLEAAGIVAALRAGIALDSVQRPLAPTRVTRLVSNPES